MRLADIPEHLHRNRRDMFGKPVPWAQAWGEKGDLSRIKIRECQAAKEPAMFWEDDFEGQPIWDMLSPQRQRQAFVFGLCMVCRRPLDWQARALVISTSTTEKIDLAGSLAFVCTEPWLCPDCAYFSLKFCAALIGRRSANDLVFASVDGPEQCVLVMSKGSVDGPFQESTELNPVALRAKVHIFESEMKVFVP